MRLSRSLAVLASLAVAATLLPVAPAVAGPRDIAYRDWGTSKQFDAGTHNGTEVVDGRLQIAEPAGTATVEGTRYEWSGWASPRVSPGFTLTELIPSWVATTPGATWIRVDVIGFRADGRGITWDTVSRWASTDRQIRRSSGNPQPDGGARVLYDTWIADPGVREWQVRVRLYRKAGTSASPSVDTVGAVASRVTTTVPSTSKPLGVAAGKRLAVPRYSQMIHRGEYAQYNGGGQAWCSPTATSMVLGYYDALPPAKRYAWVRDGYPDPFVAHAARQTYDVSFGGTGNWPFNTAYAATQTGRGFVTRLQDLRDAERFIAAGIPVITSITFGSGQLSGAPISSTNGHLLVVVGFTKAGDVVVNDPAAASASGVRRTYDRAQFEAAWMRKSKGLTYVITDAEHPLPARNGSARW